MTFTDKAKALLKRLEGRALAAYQDSGGVWTIGYGHTGDVHDGQIITDHQAEVILDYDLQRFIVGVQHCLANTAVPLSDNQFSALVIFAFNVGLIAFSGSTALRNVLNGHLSLVPHELERWVHIHDTSGVPVKDPGLVARRKAEITLWNTAGVPEATEVA